VDARSVGEPGDRSGAAARAGIVERDAHPQCPQRVERMRWRTRERQSGPRGDPHRVCPPGSHFSRADGAVDIGQSGEQPRPEPQMRARRIEPTELSAREPRVRANRIEAEVDALCFNALI
jgi:hypothetical protein